MKEKIINVLRWIAILPASVLGSYLVYIIFFWLNKTKEGFTNADNLWDIGIMLVSSALMGGAFVLIGAYVAPSGKRVVSIVLLCLMCALIGIAIFSNLMGEFSLVSILSSLCMLAGSGYATYSVFKDNN